MNECALAASERSEDDAAKTQNDPFKTEAHDPATFYQNLV
jgi:hypothetical protein